MPPPDWPDPDFTASPQDGQRSPLGDGPTAGSGRLVFVLDAAGRFTDCNGATTHFLGETRATLLGTPYVARFVPEALRPALTALLACAQAGQETPPFLHPLAASNVSPQPFRWTFLPLRAPDDTVTGVEVSSEAIVRYTDPDSAAERSLRETDARYRFLFNEAPLAQFSINIDRQIRDTNRQATALLGYSAEAFRTLSVTDLYADTPAGKSKAKALFQRFLDGERIVDEEMEMVRQDGQHIWVSLTVRPLFDDQGNVIASQSIVMDVTARKKAQEALRESERQYRRVVELAQEGIWAIDAQGRTTVVNPSMAQMLGYTKEEMIGRHLFDFMDDEGRANARANLARREAGIEEQHDFVFRHKAGHPVYTLIETAPILDDDGQYQGAVAGIVDITARKKAEAALTASEERYELAVRGASVGIWDWEDVSKDYEYWSPKVYELIGYAPGEIPSAYSTLEGLIHPDDRVLLQQTTERAIAQQQHFTTGEYRIRVKDGTYRWFSGTGYLQYDAAGTARRMVGTLADIEDRKQAEADRERLIEALAEKNKELERFAYTVSHDLKTPLFTILGFLSMVEEHAEAGDMDLLHDDAARIRNAAHTMQALLDGLLQISRIGRITNPRVVVDLAALTQEAADQATGHFLQHDAHLHIVPDMPPVYGDRIRLLEVMQNLLENAAKYRRDTQAPEIHVDARQEGNRVLVWVQDNGRGIAPRHHDRIFGLFERLPPKTQDGTGIGLALCKRIVEAHDGRIWVESEGNDQGSTFFFTLPSPPVETQPPDDAT